MRWGRGGDRRHQSQGCPLKATCQCNFPVEGHCYLPQPKLVESALELLKSEFHAPLLDAIALVIFFKHKSLKNRSRHEALLYCNH